MQKGQHEYATRKAHELFDAWNDVTGVFPKFTGYYYEILGVIEDAVRVGSMVALGVEFEIKEGNLTQRALDFACTCAAIEGHPETKVLNPDCVLHGSQSQ